jgi:hypothetical protein
MGKALVIYESMFGNTHAVADAVAEGLRESLDVEVLEVEEAPLEVGDDVDLVVVGGPTHAFSMSRPSTRHSAGEQGADPGAASHSGIREWISGVAAPKGLATAAFDTRIAKPHLPGSAAKSADRKLRRRGFTELAHPESFYVTDTSGGLVEGELERAKAWGVELTHH